MFSIVSLLAAIAVVAGALHLVWEGMHVSLYGGYETLTRLPITFYATIGDVGYTIGAVLLAALFKGNFRWLSAPSMRDLAGLAVMGALIALFVEYKALALGRWFYLDAMPMIPILNVGLTPILQMMILLPFSVWVAAMIFRGIVGR